LVAFLDGDDVWLPGKLERQVESMTRHDGAFSFTRYGVIGEDGQPRASAADIPNRVTYPDLLKRTVIGCSTVMLDLEKTGPVRMPELRSRQDYVLWYSILKRGLVAQGLQEMLTLYRVVRGSVSRNKLLAAARLWRVYRQTEKLRIAPAAYYFCHYACHAAFRKVRQRLRGHAD
jgi:teichuronic acid biosynthesis glycosyltransferase TuaG